MDNKIQVIPNIKDYSSVSIIKKPGSEYVMGLAGFNKANKGLMKALKIFNKFHSEDSRWVLRLAGDHFDVESLDYGYWKDVCEPYILSNGLSDFIHFDGFQEISKWLEGIGFILSVSDREGTHEALVEGVSSGSIPIILDWEMVKRFGGVRKLYPFLNNYIFDRVDSLDSVNTKYLHNIYEKDRVLLSHNMKNMHNPKEVVNDVYKFIRNVYEA